jgi:hypothetical protein
MKSKTIFLMQWILTLLVCLAMELTVQLKEGIIGFGVICAILLVPLMLKDLEEVCNGKR